MDAAVGVEPTGQPDREERRERDRDGHRHRAAQAGDHQLREHQAADHLAAHQPERAQGRDVHGHRVHGAGDGLADEHEARQRGRGGEQQEPDALDVRRVHHALVVLGEIADRDLGAGNGCAVDLVGTEMEHAGDVGVEPHRVGARPEPDHQVRRLLDVAGRHVAVAHAVTLEHGSAGEEGGFVRQEELVDRGVADADHPRRDRGTTAHRCLAVERCQVVGTADRHAVAHRDPERRGRLPVHDDLVEPVGVREPAGDEERSCDGPVQLRVGGREAADLLVVDRDRHGGEGELAAGRHLGEPADGAVVGRVRAGLGTEDDRVGRGRRLLVPGEGRVRPPGSRDRRDRYAPRGAGEQAEQHGGRPAPRELAAGPEPCRAGPGGRRRGGHGVILTPDPGTRKADTPGDPVVPAPRPAWRTRLRTGLHFRCCREPCVPWTAEVTR